VETFFQFIWLVIVSFAFVAYLIILFQIVTDLYSSPVARDFSAAMFASGWSAKGPR